MLPSEIPWVLYEGDGSRGPFPIAVDGTPISFADKTHLRVTRFDVDGVATELVEGTDYQLSSVTALPDLNDIMRTVTAAALTLKVVQPVLAEGEYILIERIAPPTQDISYTQSGGFSSSANERNLDAIVRVVQQLAHAVSRTFSLNRLDETGENVEYPTVADRKGKFLAFHPTTGAPVASGGEVGTGDMISSNNLSELTDIEEARNNLELDDVYFRQDANLSEGNAASIRGNLGVYSSAQTDSAITSAINAILGGVSSAFDTLAEIATDLALKALKTTVITAAGLAIGGGSLAADRTITVPAASSAEAKAMAALDRALTPANLADIGAHRVHAHSAVAQSHTGGTTEHQFVASTIAGGDIGANGWIEVETVWTVTNNANTKTPRVRFGAAGAGTGGTAYFAPSAFSNISSGRVITIIQNRGATNSQVGGLAIANAVGFGTGGGAAPTSAIDTTANVDVYISGTLGTGTDTITLESYTIRVFKRA